MTEGELRSDHNGKWLQIRLAVEDDGALVLRGKEPSAQTFSTHSPGPALAYGGPRHCGREAAVPTAKMPDF
jgi:hypothetical protein